VQIVLSDWMDGWTDGRLRTGEVCQLVIIKRCLECLQQSSVTCGNKETM
jgi:hypothetical protein